jgi:hypothetical protein
MSDLLATGAAWLAGQLSAGASRSVRYSRGADFGSVLATIGTSRFESQGTSGVVEMWESRDFVIKAGSLPFGEPLRHDKIVETLNGVDVTYEVTSPRGVPVFHWGDAFRQTVRVHTIATAEAAQVAPTLRRRFWGSFAATTITDAQIVASLANDLGGSRAQSRTITAHTAYIYVVLPTSFGVPTFAVSGLTSSAWETTTRTITFAGQAAASYGIHRTTYPITGTVNLVVT